MKRVWSGGTPFVGFFIYALLSVDADGASLQSKTASRPPDDVTLPAITVTATRVPADISTVVNSITLLEVFRRIKAMDPYLPILLLWEEAAQSKPNPELEAEVLAVIELPLCYKRISAVLQQVEVYRHTRHEDGTPRSLELFRNLVGSSQGIQRVRKMIEMVASRDANVLIIGESGTGKEVVARRIHYHSKRRNKPFVPLNCGAIPPDLLESELFGHEKGAFTGAIISRQGRFEMAEGGTLLSPTAGPESPFVTAIW